MQFPWACMSMHDSYSSIIQESFSSPAKYVSVGTEREYTKKALKIVVDARIKKKKMHQRPEEYADAKSRILATNNVSKIGNSHMTLPDDNHIIDQPSERQMGSSLIVPQESIVVKAPRSVQKEVKKSFFITSELLDFKVLQSKASQSTSNRHSTVQNLESSTISKSQTLSVSRLYGLSKARNVSHWEDSFARNDQLASQSRMSPGSIDLANELPKFKAHLTDHTEREVRVFEGKVSALIQDYNNLVAANKTLAKHLKTLKTNEVNTERIVVAIHDIGHLERQLEETIARKHRSEEERVQATNYQERLKMIVHVCEENKKEDSKWTRALNAYLGRVRRLIQYERDEMRVSLTEVEEIQRLANNLRSNLYEQRHAENQVMTNLKTRIESKRQLDDVFYNADHQIERAAIQKAERINNQFLKQHLAKEEARKKILIEKSNKNLNERREAVKTNYDKICHAFNLEPGQQLEEKPEYIAFLDSLQKQEDLERARLEREEMLSSLRQQVEYQKRILETLELAREEENEQEKNTKAQQEEASLEELELRLKKLNHHYEETVMRNQKEKNASLVSLMALNRVCAVVGINRSFHETELAPDIFKMMTDKLNEKLQFIKEKVSPEEFEKVQQGDFHELYNRKLGLGFSSGIGEKKGDVEEEEL
eukprot:TRINITY_DN4766_c0_g3_i1.p1 TRINITY_DN4766_c0_g3~~TRINITY_DN4766_c0_g3_i1.p1  ORF type:complete len:653 (+),score=157.44 TRINITY_DN4766_c0_g3_i1:41-1999(+)